MVRRRRRSVKRLHRSLIAPVSVSVLSNGLRTVRSAHGRFRNGRLCARSIAFQMALPSERLFLVFSFDPNTDDAFCVDRIRSGTEPTDSISLWASVGYKHLVPGACDPARRRFVAAADFAPQILAQECGVSLRRLRGGVRAGHRI